MSAWICSDKHINAMVTFAASHDVYVYVKSEPFYVRRNCQMTAEILKAQNVRSVDYRYSEFNCLSPIRYTPTNGYTAVQIIKACHCYDYQACETPDYEETTAKRICDAIESAAINALPGYDEAAWGID